MGRISTVSIIAVSFAASQTGTVVAQDWSGYYIGVNAGVAKGKAKNSFSLLGVDTTDSWFFPDEAPTLESALSGAKSDSHFIGGIQAGRNWQSGNLVYGVELDFSSVNIAASRRTSGVFPTSGFNYTASTEYETDWMFSTRGRLGWSLGSILVYGTAGLAITDLRVSGRYEDQPLPGGTEYATGNWSTKKNVFGWTLGGGLEWAIDRKWSLKTEYIFSDFSSATAGGAINSFGGPVGYSNGLTDKVDLTTHVARAGLNYKF